MVDPVSSNDAIARGALQQIFQAAERVQHIGQDIKDGLMAKFSPPDGIPGADAAKAKASAAHAAREAAANGAGKANGPEAAGGAAGAPSLDEKMQAILKQLAEVMQMFAKTMEAMLKPQGAAAPQGNAGQAPSQVGNGKAA